MADNFNATAGDGTVIGAADDIGGVKYPRVKVNFGTDGNTTDVSASAPLPVDASGSTVPVSGPLTDTELRATAVPISGTVTVTGVATSANQTTEIAAINHAASSLGVIGTSSPGNTTTIGFEDGSGNTINVSVSNALPIDGFVSVIGNVAIQCEGIVGEGAPTFAMEIGFVEAGGNLTAVAPTTPLPVSQTGNVTLAAGTNSIGNVSVVTTVTTVATVSSVTNIVDGNLTSAGNVTATGKTASNAALTANPVTTGGRAATSNPTAVDDGDVVDRMMTKHGKTVIRHDLRENQGDQFTYLTDGNLTTIVTADANNKLDIHHLVFTNKGTNSVSVLVKDDTTARIEFGLPPGNVSIGLVDRLPLLQAAGNKTWSATLSAAPSGGNVSVHVGYVKAGA